MYNKSEILADAELVQDICYNNVNKRSVIGMDDFYEKQSKIEPVLTEIVELSSKKPEIVKSYLGEFADRIVDFLAGADLHHPNLYLMEFINNKNLLNCILEVLRHNTVSETTSQIFSEWINNSCQSYKKDLYRVPVHLRNSEEAKAAGRNKKDIFKIVSLSKMNKTADYSFENSLKSFMFYSRFSSEAASNYATSLNEFWLTLRNSGLANHSAKLKEYQSFLNNFSTENYLGFSRLKMVDASVILAKIIGLNFGHKYGSDSCQIYADKNWLRECQYNFYSDSLAECETLAYQPHAYPLAEFSKHVKIPERTQKIYDIVENHPDVNGKSVFDYYWVLCPGFAYPLSKNKKPNLADAYRKTASSKSRIKTKSSGEGSAASIRSPKQQSVEYFASVEEARKKLDVYFTQENIFSPIVLGELNGLTYFICYWF